MARHFAGEATIYFTADGRIRTPEVLLMIDVDCHRKGDLTSATAFAQHLRDHFFPGLYFEPSTNGNGVHAYLLLDTRGFGDERTHALFGMLDRALKGIHADWQSRNPQREVELVEVKGHPPRLAYGRDGRVASYTSGLLAKLPREIARRWNEFRRTPMIDDRRVSDLHREWRVEKEVAVPREASPPAGSITGHVVGREALDRFEDYLILAAKLLPAPLGTSGREVATSGDLAILLLILEACTKRMNADGSMPTARIMRNWDALYEQGDVDRPFNPKRYACLRDFLSREGLLDWEDECYLPHQMSAAGMGKSARWRASERLLAMIEEAREGRDDRPAAQDACEEQQDGRGAEPDEGGDGRGMGDKDHLYGDKSILDWIGPMTAVPDEGNISHWLVDLTIFHYPRPVLRVPIGKKWAA